MAGQLFHPARLVNVTTASLLILLLFGTSATSSSFIQHKLVPLSGHDDIDRVRQGRYFYFGNGTAMVNATTVGIGATFASFIGLGFLSIYSQAVEEANNNKAAAAAAAAANKQGDEDAFAAAEAEYERQYAKYLREYAIWAHTYGQSSIPPPEPLKKRFIR